MNILNVRQKVVLIMVLLAIAVVATGCGTPKLYGEVGLGYKLVTTHDRLLPEYGGGRNPSFHIEGGLEWKSGIKCGISHWSHVRDGKPFNDYSETYKDELVCKVGFGGY